MTGIGPALGIAFAAILLATAATAGWLKERTDHLALRDAVHSIDRGAIAHALKLAGHLPPDPVAPRFLPVLITGLTHLYQDARTGAGRHRARHRWARKQQEGAAA